MSAHRVDRRLAAILSADVVGYSRLMAEDERETLRALKACQEVTASLVRQHRGRVVDSPGDNLLAEFPSALDAVEAAVEIQHEIAARNLSVPAQRRMEYRIGVHLGDVMVDGDRIYGDGVNIAARLQALAEPGGICVSGAVHEQVGKKLAVSYRDLGAQSLKNIPEPVRAYSIRTDGLVAPPKVPPRVTRSLLAVASVLVLAAAIFAAWRLLPLGASPGPIRSLAVLPLENLSGDPEQEYFADGMTETLIGDLGKIGSLKVISRTSVMQYKGARKPLREIAAELGVDALLEGTVMREGERVRVTAQLIDGRTDHHLWAERYDRDLRGILELQSDVARSVAREVELELSPGEAARLANRPPVDPAAHDALLKGIYHFGRTITPESMKSALASFERAIELAPAYAPAHAWLAFAWLFLTNAVYVVPDRQGMPKAKSAALRALELDDALPEAHGALGSVALNFDWDWPASERHFQRALELNPSLPWPHVGYAWYLISCGRVEDAIAEARRAAKLDPLSLLMRGWPVGLYFYAGRFTDALDEAQAVREMDPTWLGPGGEIYNALGRYEESIAAFERLGVLNPEQASELRAALSRGGREGYLREVLRLLRGRPVPVHIRVAAIHAQLGERDEAFAELERAYAAREGDLVWLRTFPPGLASIRDDPRFDELVRRIGIPES